MVQELLINGCKCWVISSCLREHKQRTSMHFSIELWTPSQWLRSWDGLNTLQGGPGPSPDSDSRFPQFMADEFYSLMSGIDFHFNNSEIYLIYQLLFLTFWLGNVIYNGIYYYYWKYYFLQKLLAEKNWLFQDRPIETEG